MLTKDEDEIIDEEMRGKVYIGQLILMHNYMCLICVYISIFIQRYTFFFITFYNKLIFRNYSKPNLLYSVILNILFSTIYIIFILHNRKLTLIQLIYCIYHQLYHVTGYTSLSLNNLPYTHTYIHLYLYRLPYH